jgi:hypothetical protein
MNNNQLAFNVDTFYDDAALRIMTLSISTLRYTTLSITI